MRRRDFLVTVPAGAMLLGERDRAQDRTPERQDLPRARPGAGAFRLRYAPHFGMFRHHAGDDLGAQLQFMADEGFSALEDNGMAGRPVEEQERIAREMARLRISMGVFVVNMQTAWTPTLATGSEDARERFLGECRAAVDVARRVNATWMTVVPGAAEPRLGIEYQTASVVEALRRAAAIFEPHGLIMVLEPLNPRDHPGLFLTTVAQAFLICRAVNSPACKMLDDLYHQQITEGNLIPNIDRAWSEIAYIQLGDNPGRNEPGTGEINFRNIFRHLHGKGFAGIVGMEHGNSAPGKDGERAVIDAYRQCDGFAP
jgi:hydroxypyruvate isomerase